MPVKRTRSRINVTEFHRMIKDGSLSKSDGFELLDGHVVERHPVRTKRATCIKYLTSDLQSHFGDKATISVKKPLCLDEHTELRPDLCVLRPRTARSAPTPADVQLIVEYTESSGKFSQKGKFIREVKLPLYAQAFVPEVWLMDFLNYTVEVYAQPSGGKYKKPKVFKGRENIISAAIPDFSINVNAALMNI